MGKHLLVAISGALLGVAIMLAVQSHGDAGSAIAPPALPASRAPHPPGDARDRVLAARLDRLEARFAETAATAAAAPDPASPGSAAPVDRQAGLDDARRAFARRLVDHAAAPRDAAWAAATERAITAAIAKLARDGQPGFALAAVDCRSSTCVARLQWPSSDAARVDARAIVENADVPCARQIVLPEAAGGGSYEASLLFGCAR